MGKDRAAGDLDRQLTECTPFKCVIFGAVDNIIDR